MLFTILDILDFYSSISEDLLNKYSDYARIIDAIDDNAVEVIMLPRGSWLIDRSNIWVKKQKPTFDVIMGISNSAEI